MEIKKFKLLQIYILLFFFGSSLLYLSFGQGVLQFREGDRIVLDCRSTEDSLSFSYEWTKNDSGAFVYGGRISKSSNGTLIILNSTLNDQGTYVCFENGKQKMSLFVKVLPRIDSGKPQDIKTYKITIRLVNNEKHDAIIKYTTDGETRQLKVSSNGHKTDTIQIRASSVVEFRAFDSVNNEPLQMNDKAIFYVVPTLQGQEVTIHIPNAYLWFVNQIPQSQKLIRKRVGESLTLDCFAKGFPPPTVEWYKWNHSIGEVSYRLYRKTEANTMWYFTLKDLVLADSGEYACAVENRLATIKRRFEVVVQERHAVAKPEIVKMTPQNSSVRVGTEVVFKCEVRRTFIMPYVRWEKRVFYTQPKNETKGNMTIRVDPVVRLRRRYIQHRIAGGNVTVQKHGETNELIEVLKTERTYSSVLRLDPADYVDEAEYVCIAFNTLGYSSASGFLYVEPVPAPSLKELAERYASRFAEAGSYSDLPLSVIIALPVGLIVLLVIGFIWWNEQQQRRKDADQLSLIPLSTMRNDDMFDSEEHLPRHYPKNHQKRLSQTRTASEGDEPFSDQYNKVIEDTSLGKVRTAPLISSVEENHLSKDILRDEEKPECDRKIAALILSCPDTCSPEPDSMNCSEIELEWEPQDLDLDLGRVH